jgi:hypothetical protein
MMLTGKQLDVELQKMRKRLEELKVANVVDVSKVDALVISAECVMMHVDLNDMKYTFHEIYDKLEEKEQRDAAQDRKESAQSAG